MIVLRPYQEAAKAAVYQHLRERDDNPCVVIPTGAGKTPLIASICREAVECWQGRVLVLAHVKELLEQAVDKLRAVCPTLPVGVYSAGLRRRDKREAVIVAGIQSVFRRACELDAFDLVIVDEAHTIPPEGEGMYRQFLSEARVVNPQLRVIGCTATPFRLDSGPICRPDHFLNHICFEVGVRELIVQGYLSPLVTKAGKAKVDAGGLQVRGGEFVAEQVEALMDDDKLVEAASDEIVEHSVDRNACLIFASGVNHAMHLVEALQRRGQDCGFVCGKTAAGERSDVLARFRRGELKYLVNVNVLTVGFDAPNVDCVVLLRPTLSPGLFYQMVGRGFRLHPGKRNCLVLDFGGNVLRHGPVDLLRVTTDKRGDAGAAPAKECPECQAVIAAGYATCPECGFVFPPPNRQRHEPKASEAGILSGQITDTEYEVRDMSYTVHTKRGAPPEAPRTMRVSYRLGLNHWQSEFVCFEHTGFARQKAVAWWKARSTDPMPATAQEAVDLANEGRFRHVESITVRNVAGEKYDRIVGYVFGEEELAAAAAGGLNDEEIPF